MRCRFLFLILGALFFIDAVAAEKLPPIQPVPHVDLPRFMGQWYMIATIPTSFERDAWNALQNYTLEADGSILTSLRLNKGAADGPVKQAQAPAYVRAGSDNAVWGVRLFGPIKLQYIVAWLKPDYSLMIVARDARDHVWVFSRTPAISADDWSAVHEKVTALGYDLSKLREVPQLQTSD